MHDSFWDPIVNAFTKLAPQAAPQTRTVTVGKATGNIVGPPHEISLEASPEPPYSPQAERAYHQFQQVVERAARCHELQSTLIALRSELGQMGGWYFDAAQCTRRDRAVRLAVRITELVGLLGMAPPIAGHRVASVEVHDA